MATISLSTKSTATYLAGNRLMYGPKPEDLQNIESTGYGQFLDQQLHPDTIDDAQCEEKIAALSLTTLSEDWAQLFDRRKIYSDSIVPIVDVSHATLARMIHSKRQLFEKIVHFWYDHFNIYGWNFFTRSMWPKWDETIRKNALGNFKTFLIETAKHPCMLYYLDNYLSTNGGPNENYARELIELHTMGAENYNQPGGYVDDDVYEASRCFTGWTINFGSEAPERGQFHYDQNTHDRFQKYFLGNKIDRDQLPLQDGLDVLNALADHPGTAKHITRKLCTRFISDNPPESIIESAADIFFTNKDHPNQIKLTLEHIFTSDEFLSSENQKFKTPIEWLVSFMRILEIPYINVDKFSTYKLVDDLGQALFKWRTPDGPPDNFVGWANSNGLMQRWQLAFVTSADWYKKYEYFFLSTDITPSELTNPEELVDWWVERIFSKPISNSSHEALVKFVADGRNPSIKVNSEVRNGKIPHLAAMCTTTPEFMWH